MRNISFQLTTEQVRSRTKTVTRRLGWRTVRPGDLLQAIVKGQGLKKGEHPEKLCVIRVVNVNREPLNHLTISSETGPLKVAIYGAYFYDDATRECAKEGFPKMSPESFVEFFCKANGCPTQVIVTRIEFEYV
jgi:hypothetical protein